MSDNPGQQHSLIPIFRTATLDNQPRFPEGYCLHESCTILYTAQFLS